MRAENVPVAICTTRTVTVTTKPVSAAVAPMIEDRTVLAVDGEYCHRNGVPMFSSANETTRPRTPPSAAPARGMTQRLSSRLSRLRNRLAQVISLVSFGAWIADRAAPRRSCRHDWHRSVEAVRGLVPVGEAGEI